MQLQPHCGLTGTEHYVDMQSEFTGNWGSGSSRKPGLQGAISASNDSCQLLGLDQLEQNEKLRSFLAWPINIPLGISCMQFWSGGAGHQPPAP